MKKLIITSIALLVWNKIYAQTTILEQYIRTGLENNLSLKQENLEIEKAIKAIEIAKSNYSPKISFAPNYTLAAGGRRLDFPIGDLLNPVYSTLNTLTKSTNFPQLENINTLLAPNNFHDTKLSIQYPVFNPEIKYNVGLQKEMLQSEYAKKKYLENELAQNIRVAYFQLLLADAATDIYKNAKKTLLEVENLNQKLVNNDVALKDIVLSAQYDVSKIENEIIKAETNSDLSKKYFNFLINQKLDDVVIIDTNLIKKQGKLSSLSYYNEYALEHRPELKQLDAGIKTTEALILLQEKSAKLPSVFIGGNTGFQGFGYKIWNNQGYGLVQMGLNWDLYHGYEKKKKIESTKLSRSITQLKKDEVKNQILMQVSQWYMETESHQKQLTIHQIAKEKTQKILDLVKTRFNNGAAIYLEFSKAQNDHLQSQLTERIAQYEYLTKLAQLYKAAAITE